MRQILLAAASCVALIACSQSATQQTSSTAENATPSPATPASEADIAAETARFTEWLDVQYSQLIDFSPLTKTFLGIKDADYAKVDDMSLEAASAQLDWRRASVAEMKDSFDPDLLSEDAKISYEMWAYDLMLAEEAARFPLHPYAFEQMGGVQSFYPQFLLQFHTVETVDDMQAYVSRINGFARALNQQMDKAEAAAAKDIRAPRFAYEGVIEQSQKILTGAPFDGSSDPSDLLADARAKADSLVEAGLATPDEANDLYSQAEAAYAGPFAEALMRVVIWHESGLPDLGEPSGARALPDGEAYYAQRLLESTTTNLTAEEIHQIGLSEVARIRAEMETLKDSVGFDGELADFFQYVRMDDQFFFPNTDEGRESYLQGARDHIDFIKGKLPEYFGILPKADLIVKRVEAFREQDGAAQHYFPGTPDGSRPGIYYAHLSDMTAMPKNQMEVIAYHEGLPGHHMQISIAQELEGVPKFRTQAYYNAFGEGWALYSEELAKEMGAYQDPYSEFGRLSSEMFRAIRLVVDTGLHAKGWSEQEAVDYFLANSPEPEEGIRSEVQRYMSWPGQATGYKIGMIKIQELRARAEAQLGDAFDIRGFHDVVLGGGTVPLDVLETRVDQWITSQSAN